MYKNPKSLENTFQGYVRVLHAVPGAPNVDVYVNDKLVVKDLSYGSYTEYLALNEGRYKISVYPTGTKNSPILTNMITLNKNDIFTVAAIGALDSLGLLAIVDSNMPIPTNNAKIRFAHLSPDAPAVDITLPDGTLLFSNVSYKQVAPYIPVPPSNYTLQVRLSGTPTTVLTVPNVQLESKKHYTVYALGLVDETPELEALLVLDSFGII